MTSTSKSLKPINLKDNTTPLENPNEKMNNNSGEDTKPKKLFRENNFGKKKLERNPVKRTQYSNSNYLPYSTQEVQKAINYFGYTCANYAYSSALRNYLGLLQKYKRGQLPRAPKYPNICEYQSENPKPYKRPAMYQGVGRTASPSFYNCSSAPPHEIIPEKEVTLLHEIPEEISVMIK